MGNFKLVYGHSKIEKGESRNKRGIKANIKANLIYILVKKRPAGPTEQLQQLLLHTNDEQPTATTAAGTDQSFSEQGTFDYFAPAKKLWLYTLPRNDLLSRLYWGAQVSMEIS